jgi:hypothetical protein
MTLLAKGCDQETAKKNPHEIHIPLKLILPTGTPPTDTLFLLGDGGSVVDDLNFQLWTPPAISSIFGSMTP